GRGKARLACAHGPATARHFQNWARSSRQPATDRAWERGAPARSLYLVRNDSCGNWRGNRCSQGRAFCAPSTENFSGPSANEGSKLTPASGRRALQNMQSPAQLTQKHCEGVLPRAAVSPRLPSVRSGLAIFAITLSKK